MTSFRLSELPTPYRSAGASPLGAHEGTVTPPEPPTPTGTVYFSGTSTYKDGPHEGMYAYAFDRTAFENADEFITKQLDDTVSVTINGTEATWAIAYCDSYEDSGSTFYEYGIGDMSNHVSLSFETSGGTTTVTQFDYIIDSDLGDSVTLEIADAS